MASSDGCLVRGIASSVCVVVVVCGAVSVAVAVVVAVIVCVVPVDVVAALVVCVAASLFIVHFVARSSTIPLVVGIFGWFADDKSIGNLDEMNMTPDF